MSDPTDYVGTYDTTEVGGGDHQNVTKVTHGAFLGYIPGRVMAPEGVADAEQAYAEGAVPVEHHDTAAEGASVRLPKRTVRRK
jgi:hypothetical protein